MNIVLGGEWKLQRFNDIFLMFDTSGTYETHKQNSQCYKERGDDNAILVQLIYFSI
jgi:hypothetical protein